VASACSVVSRSTVDDEGQPADGSSREAVLSESGRFLAFTSVATDLVGGDTNGFDDIFRRDHHLQHTALVSVGLDGTPANGSSWSPTISASGRYVAFVSAASNLVESDTNGVADVFVRDLLADVTQRVSHDETGGQLPLASGVVDCDEPSPSSCAPTVRSVALSADGSQVAFVSEAAAGPVVRWHDRSAGTVTVALVPDTPEGSTGSAYTDLAMSADGSTLAFTEVHATAAGNVAGLGRYERTTGTRSWILPPDPGAPPEERSPANTCCSPDLSADGRWLAFATPVAAVPEDDAAGAPRDVDVFVRDLTTGATERVSRSAGVHEIDGGAYGPSLSDDAARVTFWTADATLVGDGVTTTQLYLHERATQRVQRVSESSEGAANAPATGGLSGDGRLAVMASTATNLDGPGNPGVTDLFVRLAARPVPAGSPVPVPAGATATPLVIPGAFLDETTDVEIDGLGVELDGVTTTGGALTITVTVDPGAALGVRRVELEQDGPFGLGTRTVCNCLTVTWSHPPADPVPDRPNVLVIVTDDQRADDVDDMPGVAARTDWARFGASFVNEPMCCPARATILTGRYSHNTGVETLIDGEDLDEATTVATMLDGAGYRTGFIGKYLNGYPFGQEPYAPSGWDSWAAYVGGTDYRNYTLFQDDAFEDGALRSYGTADDDYSTDRFASMARTFLRQTPPADPFLLVLALNAPHHTTGGGLPRAAPRHRFGCPDFELELPPSFNAHDTVSEPDWMNQVIPPTASLVGYQRVATCRALLGADEAVISLLDELAASGRLDDTYVILTSDNGFSFGEHRLLGKGHLYEESVRVPLLVRGPDVVPGAVPRLTSNVDLTPTILDWAGVTAPTGFLDGTSFADDLRGTDVIPNPHAVLLRGCRTGMAPPRACGGHNEDMGLNWGLRTERYKYVEYPDGDVQLFDLWLDPDELTNRADDPGYVAVRALLAARLDQLQGP
jgi:arylsulfatase A-like enzyme/Tol biopolymer transport system component